MAALLVYQIFKEELHKFFKKSFKNRRETSTSEPLSCNQYYTGTETKQEVTIKLQMNITYEYRHKNPKQNTTKQNSTS